MYSFIFSVCLLIFFNTENLPYFVAKELAFLRNLIYSIWWFFKELQMKNLPDKISSL